MTEVDLFQAHRPALFARRVPDARQRHRRRGRACRTRGCASRRRARRTCDPPKAYLTTIVTRLCLDRLKSARATREEYVGPWLPEPVVTDDRREPERSLALAESVTLAFMVLLETLSPEERAVFLLREVFDYEYDEIAAMLETTPRELPAAVPPRQGADRRAQAAVPRDARREAAAGRALRPRVQRRRARTELTQRARRGRRLLERRRWQGAGGAASALRPRAGRQPAGRHPPHGAGDRCAARVGDARHRRGQRRAGARAARRRPAGWRST